MIGFEDSAWRRLAVAAVFCAAAVFAVAAIEARPDAPPPAAASATAAARELRLEVGSTFPVARWQVSVLGAAQTASASDAWSWSGTVAAPVGEEVLVQAAAADGAPANRALRIRLGDRPEHVVWGSGDMAVAETLP